MDRNPNAIVHIGMIAWVALRKESVDRNKCAVTGIKVGIGRSPQGERG